MRELAYKPNNLARSLQGKSAKLIGLIFPNISNVFYAELIDKLEHELFKQGYKTIICNSEHDSDKEREYLEMLEANQVDGIISGSHNLGIEDYNRVTAPIIAFDRNLSPDIPVVSSDNYGGGVLAAQTLVKAGAQNIIMTKPDGIFTSDDLKAILIMKVAQELNIQIPEDLKIIGYDGTYFVENYYPQLATIKQPMKDIARLSVDLLLKKIAGQEVQTTGYFLPVSILPGKSV